MSIDTPSDDELDGMSDDELINRLRRLVELSAAAIREAARVWCRLEDRGVDLSRVRLSIRGYLRRVHQGTVLAEAVAKWAGTKLLGRIAALSVDEQRRLVDDGRVAVVEAAAGGAFTHRMVPVSELRTATIDQVFGDGYIRDDEEQKNWLRGLKPAAWTPRRPKLGGKMKIDRSAGTVQVGKTILALQDVIDDLRAAGVI